MENYTVISDDPKIANIFNNSFINIISSLKIKLWKNNLAGTTKDPIDRAIKKFSTHPSIIKIKASYAHQDIFAFLHITLEEVKKCINGLDEKKGISGEIPTHIS